VLAEPAADRQDRDSSACAFGFGEQRVGDRGRPIAVEGQRDTVDDGACGRQAGGFGMQPWLRGIGEAPWRG
jgi:hypothetical protein